MGGTAYGKNVPEGVYFIVVEAEGADGVNYKIKSDINILKELQSKSFILSNVQEYRIFQNYLMCIAYRD